jgi:hypothetical protein
MLTASVQQAERESIVIAPRLLMKSSAPHLLDLEVLEKARGKAELIGSIISPFPI